MDSVMTDRRGLLEIADGVFVYLQADGGWGWSNSGLLTGDWSSLLIDTLFDLRLTGQMLDDISAVTSGSPIDMLINTHADGDHCYGNELLVNQGATVVTSDAGAADM